jgi:phosphoglycerate dehydrogenase-like enzyme
MRVVACDPVALPEPGIELMGLDQLLRQSDFVSLHLPIVEATRGMFDRTMFAAMKPGALLINTARGGLVNEPDLVEALKSGQLAGAGLDVFGVEPPAADNPLLTAPNVLLCPHLAGLDSLAMSEMAFLAAQCIVDLHAGRWPTESVVNPEVAPGWQW